MVAINMSAVLIMLIHNLILLWKKYIYNCGIIFPKISRNLVCCIGQNLNTKKVKISDKHDVKLTDS